MKYITLSEEELRDIKTYIRKKLMSSYIAVTAALLILSLTLVFILKSVQTFSHLSNTEFVSAVILSIPLVMAVIYFTIQKHSIWQESGKNMKKVYLGTVSDKQIKDPGPSQKYYLYMDGKKFKVSEQDYTNFETGDYIEFHVSVHSKLLLKVSRPS